jgi:hypothetical protein
VVRVPKNERSRTLVLHPRHDLPVVRSDDKAQKLCSTSQYEICEASREASPHRVESEVASFLEYHFQTRPDLCRGLALE